MNLRLARALRRLPTSLLGGLLAARLLDEAFGFLPEGAIEQLRLDLGAGYTAMTVIFAAPYGGSLPALWWTARSDRTGRRGIVLAGGLVMAAAMAAFATATTVAMAGAASMLWGFGGSLLVHGAELELAAVPSGAPAGELQRRLRWSNLWGTVGDVAGPVLLAGVLAVGWSWRAAFWVAAGVTLAHTGWLSRHRFTAASAPMAGPDDSPAWRDPVAWRLGVYALLLMPFDEAWLAFLIAWLQVDGGLSASTAALAGIVAVAGAGLGFGPVAAVAARRSDRSVLVAAAVVIAVAGSVVATVPAWAAVSAGLVVNAGIAAAWVTVQHSALTLRPGAEGRVMSLVAGIEHAAVALPLGLGVLADRRGLGAAFAAYLAVGLAAAAVAGTARRRSPLPKPGAGGRPATRLGP